MSYKVEMRLKELLQKRGMTQKKLAQATGLRESTVSSIVRGKQTAINFQHLAKIAEALNVQDMSEIMELVVDCPE